MKKQKKITIGIVAVLAIIALILVFSKDKTVDLSNMMYTSLVLKDDDIIEDKLITNYEDFKKLSINTTQITEELFKEKDLFVHLEKFNICEEDLSEYVEITRCDSFNKIGFLVSDVCEEKCNTNVIYLFPYTKNTIKDVNEIQIDYSQLYKVCDK